MTLRLYRKKRNFKITPEPAGSKKLTRKKKLLYVIQKHAASHLHYDFRLELGGVLLSWAVPKGPCLDPTVKRLAMHVEDHPIEYGSFEGIIPPKQYGAGTVMLWDTGSWIPEEDNPREAYRKGSLTFTLDGEKLKGHWKLIRMGKNDKTWLLFKIKDEYAQPLKKFDITVEEPNSVLSDMTLDDITENYKKVWGKQGAKKVAKPKKKLLDIKSLGLRPSGFPREIIPELATLVDRPPMGSIWLHEIKFDGYRLIAIKKKGTTRLFTRNNNDWSNQFPNIVAVMDELPIDNIIVDGEVVVLDEKQYSNFQLLQNSIKEGKKPFIFYVFDLLYYDQYNLMVLPLLERKKLLHKIISSATGTLRYSDHIEGSGKDFFEKACDLGLEGIVSKDSTSAYVFGRTKSWLKIKCVQRQEFIIGGYLPPNVGKRSYFRSLMLGTYNSKHELFYHGNVGTGFTEASLKEIHTLLQKFKTDKMPFNTKPPGSTLATWIKPVLVAEVEFTEWTNDGTLRHPSFKGIREDKQPFKIKREIETSVKNLKRGRAMPKIKTNLEITNPNKILYAEDKITKGDLVDYYESIHKWTLPFIVNRPLTLVRCPTSYKKCFYQKHVDERRAFPDLHGIMIKEKDGTKEEYVYIDNEQGLITLAQLGVLEIHPWGSTIEDLEHPDRLTFDLDPAPDVLWKEVVATAFLLKKHLASIKLKSFVKTTGGKGLHVVVPIKPRYDWNEIKEFSLALVTILAEQNPTKYVTVMTKAKRKGKIFIDYLRNSRGATAVAAYSTRARVHAPVSTPLDWDELTNNFNDTYYTIKTLPKRMHTLKKDPWQNFYKLKQVIKLK